MADLFLWTCFFQLPPPPRNKPALYAALEAFVRAEIEECDQLAYKLDCAALEKSAYSEYADLQSSWIEARGASFLIPDENLFSSISARNKMPKKDSGKKGDYHHTVCC